MTITGDLVPPCDLVAPRDIFAYLEAIWISKPASGKHYIAKRLELEQKALEYSQERLVLTSGYMDWQIEKMEQRLRNMKAINTIVKEILADQPFDLIGGLDIR